MSGPGSSILLVGGDLNSVARVEAAAKAAGLGFDHVSASAAAAALGRSPTGVVVDLDDAGVGVLELLRHERDAGRLAPERVTAFFSHVDEAAGNAAREVGFRAVPRGRFWRELPLLIDDLKQPKV